MAQRGREQLRATFGQDATALRPRRPGYPPELLTTLLSSPRSPLAPAYSRSAAALGKPPYCAGPTRVYDRRGRAERRGDRHHACLRGLASAGRNVRYRVVRDGLSLADPRSPKYQPARTNLTNLCASSGRVPPLRVGAERFELRGPCPRHCGSRRAASRLTVCRRRKGGNNIRTDRRLSEIRRGAVATEYDDRDGLRPKALSR